MDDIFGGVTVPLKRDIFDLQSSELDLQRINRHAVVDHFSIDLDKGMILLGPLARKFHAIRADDDLVGIRHFVEAYHASERRGLLRLIERLASDERSFHYTARLAGVGGRFVHGFIDRAEHAENVAGEWAGVMIMSRSGLESSLPFADLLPI